MEHNVNLIERKSLTISGVEHIYSFNDKKVEVKTSVGQMIIEGENLDMGKLSIDDNIIDIKGIINSITYSKERKSKENIVKRIFK
ncbi:MAG: YabP/YqfC family sporulation protein [Peptostreptococcaceae bacterium]